MKKIAFIALLFTCSCAHPLNKQQRAEKAVKMDILSNNPKENVNDIKFTQLDNNNTIGVIENKTIYDSRQRPVYIRTLYFSLNDDLTKVTVVFTN
jgi:hypothetical protein